MPLARSVSPTDEQCRVAAVLHFFRVGRGGHAVSQGTKGAKPLASLFRVFRAFCSMWPDRSIEFIRYCAVLDRGNGPASTT